MFAEIRKEYLDASRPCPLPFLLCTIGESTPQRQLERPAGFEFHHVIWVTRGAGRFWVQGEARMLTAGQGLYCAPGVPHGYAPEEEMDTRWLTFRGGEGALQYFGADSAFFFQAESAFLAATDALDRLCAGSSTVISRSAAGYQWLTDWLAAAFAPEVSTAARAMQFMEAHFAQPLTLEDVAAHVGMNRYSLCRYFARVQGDTVMGQLRRIRVAKARQFLRFTALPIEEIGRICGFESPSYFGKIFRAQTGLSPRDYRAQQGKDM